MNPLPTLLWLEYKRTSWVIYAALVGLALFALVLTWLPGVVTGLDALNLPMASAAGQPGGKDGNPTGCTSPNCKRSGESQLHMNRESDEHSTSFHWSFSRSWNSGLGDDAAPEPEPSAGAAGGDPSISKIPIPEELQLAFRPRQAVTAATALTLTGLMLLGFWIAQSREADRGEMLALYQSPVSGQTQLSLRFFYMAGSSTVVLILILAIYWLVQTSQSYAPQAPLLEAMGARVQLHWGSLFLTLLATQILPNAAFALLFIQMQNAYDLLGGKRLVGFVLVLSATLLGVRSFFQSALATEPSGAVRHVLSVISVVSNPTLDQMVSNFTPSQYRMDVPLEVIITGAGISILMLILAGRIWREVEWS